MISYHLISTPTESIQGEMIVPGDKSISHRALMLASIAQGATKIRGVLSGSDCLATQNAMRSMGVEIIEQSDGGLSIQGVGKYGLQPPDSQIDCGNSGTTMRLLAGLLSAQSFNSELIGDDSLLKRPMARIVAPLREMGAKIVSSNGRAPLLIKGQPRINGINYSMPMASAQLKSCLLLASLYAQGETRIIEPLATRDHTEKMLKAFGYPVKRCANSIIIDGQGRLKGMELVVPGDLSSAAFFIVAATLIPGSKLLIRNVGINATRSGVLQILQAMGADVCIKNKRLCSQEWIADILVRHSQLKGVTVPAYMAPSAIDEFPILFIAAAHAKGQTIFQGIEELRFKESDRIAAMSLGLQQLGIDVDSKKDSLVITGGCIQGGVVDSFHDHRVAMAFAIAGLAAKSAVKILHCENVSTSFPDFAQTANKLSMNVEVVSA